MPTWYLQANGIKKSFAAWGFINLVRERNSQGVDKVTFDAQGQLLDAASPLNFDDEVRIFRDSVQWFVGVVTKVPKIGSATEENANYEASGPWYYFDTLIFEQNYLVHITNFEQLTPAPKSINKTDLLVNPGDTYVDINNHSTPYPSSLFNHFPDQAGGLLIQSNTGEIFGYLGTSHVFLNGPVYDSYGRAVYTPEYFETPFGTLQIGVLQLMDTKAQITQALQFAITAQTYALGAPVFKIGNIDPAVPATMAEQRDMSVSEVVRNQLRWAPDAVVWFDYSTNPPTLNIGQRSKMGWVTFPSFRGAGAVEITTVNNGELTTTSVGVLSGWNIEGVNVVPRDDLQVPFVKITYETTSVVAGLPYTARIVDIYPPGAPQYGFGALIATVDLRGYSTGAYTDIQTAVIPDMVDGQALFGPGGNPALDPFAWWLARKEWPLMGQDDVIVDQITTDARQPVVEGASVDPTLLPNELVSGSHASWMGDLSCPSEQITGTLYYHTLNGQQFVKPLSTTIVSTSSTTGRYYNQSQIAYAEPVPVGLAELLYQSVGVLQYDGSITISEPECSGIIQMGQLLNLDPEWPNMNAMVVRIVENIDQGTTQVEFGPKKNLGINDLVELVRVIRSRSLSFRVGDATQSNAQQSIGLGDSTPLAQSNSTSAINQIMVASQVANPLIYVNSSDPADKGKANRVTVDSGIAQVAIDGKTTDGRVRVTLSDINNNDALNA